MRETITYMIRRTPELLEYANLHELLTACWSCLATRDWYLTIFRWDGRLIRIYLGRPV